MISISDLIMNFKQIGIPMKKIASTTINAVISILSALVLTGCSDSDSTPAPKSSKLQAGNYIGVHCLDNNDEKCTTAALQFTSFSGRIILIKYTANFRNGTLDKLELPTLLHPSKNQDNRWSIFAGTSRYRFSDDGCCIYQHYSDRKKKIFEKVLKTRADELSAEQLANIQQALTSNGLLSFKRVETYNEMFKQSLKTVNKGA